MRGFGEAILPVGGGFVRVWIQVSSWRSSIGERDIAPRIGKMEWQNQLVGSLVLPRTIGASVG